MAVGARAGGVPLSALFITSLAHSGSTLLDLLLGAHPRLVAVGEVGTLFRRLDQPGFEPSSYECSCRRPLSSCVLWGPLIEPLQRCSNDQERYRAVLDAVSSEIGPDVAPVDASKNLAALRALHETGTDVVVVSLVRDVRSWTTRYRARALERGELAWSDLIRHHGPRAPAVRFRRTSGQLFRLWYERNRELDAVVADLGLSQVRVGYEELVYEPAATVRRVLDAAGFGDGGEPDPAAGGDHLVFANRMAYTDDLRSAITYDATWLLDPSWRGAARRHPEIVAYSDERAYGDAAVPWR